MADLNSNERTTPVQLYDEVTGLSASVVLDEGVNKLRAKADVTVNSLRGFDPICDWWGWIGAAPPGPGGEIDTDGVGDPGDVVTWAAAAGDDATLFPSISVNATVQAGDTEDDLLDRLIVNLNNDSNFSTYYSARRIYADAPTLYITSKLPGPAYSRPNMGDITFTATGNTKTTPAFDTLIQRQKNTSLARDPSNPTLGVIGISGSVVQAEGEVTGRVINFAENGGSSDLRVNGSGTPVDFTILPSATKETFYNTLRFEALGNGIQFTKFLSQNSALSTGLEVTIRSNNSEITFPMITTTEDFASFFSRGPSDFDLFDVSGTDYFRATLNFPAPFQLFKQGTFATDDFIRVRINDNLSSGLVQFKFIGFGFERDF